MQLDPGLGTLVSLPWTGFSKANVASLSGFKNAFKRVQKQLLGAVILTVHCVSGNRSSVVCAMMSDGTKQGGGMS